MELEREQKRVHDDQEQDEVLEGGRGAQPPQVVSKHFIASLSIYQISTTVTYFQHYGRPLAFKHTLNNPGVLWTT